MKTESKEKLMEKRLRFEQDLDLLGDSLADLNKKIEAVESNIAAAVYEKRPTISRDADLILFKHQRDDIAGQIVDTSSRLENIKQQIHDENAKQKVIDAELASKRLPEICEQIDHLSRDLGEQYRALQGLIREHGPRLQLYGPRVGVHGGFFPILPRFSTTPIMSMMNSPNEKNTFFVP